jgi:serine/threonine protein kinase HipA of HipAB toxin-antitoxin module
LLQEGEARRIRKRSGRDAKPAGYIRNDDLDSDANIKAASCANARALPEHATPQNLASGMAGVARFEEKYRGLSKVRTRFDGQERLRRLPSAV